MYPIWLVVVVFLAGGATGMSIGALLAWLRNKRKSGADGGR